jgi:hypothetical protein
MPLESALVDWAACGTLLAAVVQWGAHVAALERAQGALLQLPALLASDGTPGPGSTPSAPGGAPPWAAVEATAAAAVDSYVRYQQCAILALMALTAQVVKYASFQAHFGVLGATLMRSARDMYHFALLLMLFVAAFGVWAQFAYGHHMEVWSGEVGGGSRSDAALGLVQFMMYDYDLPAMAAADGKGLTPLYYILFMMGITNMMLWLVRAAVEEGCVCVCVCAAAACAAPTP